MRPARDTGRFLGQRSGDLACVFPVQGLRQLPQHRHWLSSRPGYRLTLLSLFFYPFPLACGAGEVTKFLTITLITAGKLIYAAHLPI